MKRNEIYSVEQAVSGAPLSVEDDLPLGEFEFDDFHHDTAFACLREVYKQDSTAEAKQLFAKYRPKLVQYLKSEWTKCKGLSNVDEQKK